LAVYEQERNAETLPMYEFTAQIASFEPASPEQELLFTALEKKPREADRFFSALTGSVSLQEFFSSPSLFRILGIKGMGRIALGRMKSSRQEKQISRPGATSIANRR
jgi:hypothetical protein